MEHPSNSSFLYCPLKTIILFNKCVVCYFHYLKSILNDESFNPIQDWPFRGCSRIRGPKRVPLPTTCHAYPTKMKLGTVMPYL